MVHLDADNSISVSLCLSMGKSSRLSAGTQNSHQLNTGNGGIREDCTGTELKLAPSCMQAF